MNTALAVQDHGALKKQLKDLILKDASDGQIDLAIRVCDRYGFDPLLKHVVFISNNLYVTRDGLLDNAHRSGLFDGIAVEAERDADGQWIATAKVWRKDMTRPFEYSAYQPEHFVQTSTAWRKSPRAMTVKCAEVMALRRAFNISLGSAEEMGFDDPAHAIVEPPRTIGPASTPVEQPRSAPLSAARTKVVPNGREQAAAKLIADAAAKGVALSADDTPGMWADDIDAALDAVGSTHRVPRDGEGNPLAGALSKALLALPRRAVDVETGEVREEEAETVQARLAE